MRMTFRQFACNNVLRNKRTYAAYFLSSAFSVMVFFVYAVFAFHPGLAGGVINGQVSRGMHFAEAVIYVFSFFFVLYSMSAFLKSRKKEFGLMVMLGMTNMQLRRMVFLENMLIGFFATVSGISIGLIMAKTMLLSAENLLELDQTLPFYWPLEALALTFGAFIALFLLISLLTVTILKGNRLIDLIKSSDKPKPEPKSSFWLSVLSAVLLVIGYGIAFVVRGVMVAAAMIPVATIVIIGTYFLFTQLSVFLIHRSKRKRSFFWRKTNLLLLSDLAYRMKDNARIFFLVAILSTVAFSAIGSLVGFKSMYTEIMLKENPYAFEYVSREGNPSEREQQHVELIERALKEKEVLYEHYRVTLREVDVEDFEKPVTFVKASEYNAIAVAAGIPAVDPVGDETIRLYYGNPYTEKPDKNKQSIILAKDKTVLAIKETTLSYLLPVFTEAYVIADQRFETLGVQVVKAQSFHVFDTPDLKATRTIGKQLMELLESKAGGESFTFSSIAHELQVMNQWYGAVLFVGFFIGVVFFVAAGSFLYFRLYADLEDDKRKYKAIMKLGLTDRELSKVVTGQLAVLFLVPIAVATVHGAVALTSLQNMFGYSLIRSSSSVLGAFVLIQLAYFLFVRSRYLKQIRSTLHP
jgi:putative ABC transport system permease protein